MKNKYLKIELEKLVLDISGHQIFENVDEQDLEELKEKIKQFPFTNIVIEFDMEKINNSKLLNMYPYGSKESIEIWDRFVAIEISKILHNVDNKENCIYNMTEREYLEEKDNLVTSNHVKFFISIVNMPIRIYFIIKGCKNKVLYSAISSYLDEQVHETMICCDDKFILKAKDENKEEWLWNLYDYKFFDGFNDGMESSKMRSNKVLKKL